MTSMFGPFERTVAGRYLRARKGERFVSIIAVFSLVGIALGVATLIVVTSVMSGFQTELVTRILGINGDITVQAYAGQKIDDYQDLVDPHPRDPARGLGERRCSTARCCSPPTMAARAAGWCAA